MSERAEGIAGNGLAPEDLVSEALELKHRLAISQRVCTEAAEEIAELREQLAASHAEIAFLRRQLEEAQKGACG